MPQDNTTTTATPQQPPISTATVPQPKMSVDDFAKSIKTKYPQYANVPDGELTQKIITKYPQYANKVNTAPDPYKWNPTPVKTPTVQPLQRSGEESANKPQESQNKTFGDLGKGLEQGAEAINKNLASGTSDILDKAQDMQDFLFNSVGLPKGKDTPHELTNEFSHAADALRDITKNNADFDPNSQAGRIAESAVKTISLVAEIALFPEMRVAGLEKLGITTIPKVFPVLALNQFGEDYGKTGSLLESIKGAASGIEQAAEIETAGAAGKMASEGIKSLTGNQFITSATSPIFQGLGFGGMNVLHQLAFTGKVDKKEVLDNVGVGAAFGLPDLAAAVGAKSSKSLLGSPDDLIKQANSSAKTGEQLRETAMETAKKVDATTDPNERLKLLLQQNTLLHVADIKDVTDAIVKNHPEVIKSIMGDNTLSDKEKLFYIDKVNKVYNDNEPHLKAVKPYTDKIEDLKSRNQVVETNTGLEPIVKETLINDNNNQIAELEKQVKGIMAMPTEALQPVNDVLQTTKPITEETKPELSPEEQEVANLFAEPKQESVEPEKTEEKPIESEPEKVTRETLPTYDYKGKTYDVEYDENGRIISATPQGEGELPLTGRKLNALATDYRLKNKSNEPTITSQEGTTALVEKSVKESEKELRQLQDYSQETQNLYKKLNDEGSLNPPIETNKSVRKSTVFRDAQKIDVGNMTAKDYAKGVDDINKGIKSKQADQILNALENMQKDGMIKIKSGSGGTMFKTAIPIDVYFNRDIENEGKLSDEVDAIPEKNLSQLIDENGLRNEDGSLNTEKAKQWLNQLDEDKNFYIGNLLNFNNEQIEQLKTIVNGTEKSGEPTKGITEIGEGGNTQKEKTGEQQYKVGRNPQPHAIIKELPQTEDEKANGEFPVVVKNLKTGEEQTVLKSDLKAIKPKVEKSATDKIVEFLDKGKIDTKTSLNAFGVGAELWNAGIEIAKSAVKAGATIGEAIQKAIEHIKSKLSPDEKLDEQGAISALHDLVEKEDNEKTVKEYNAYKNLAPKYDDFDEYNKKLEQLSGGKYDKIVAQRAYDEVHQQKTLEQTEPDTEDPQGVENFIAATNQADNKMTGNLTKDVTILQGNIKANVLRSIKLLKDLPDEFKDPVLQSNVYDHMEDPSVELTPQEQEFKDKYIQPLLDAETALYQKIKSIDPQAAEGAGKMVEDYLPRQVKGKGSALDKLKQGAKKITSGTLLKKTDPTFRHRVYHSLTDADGNRKLVAIKDNKVTEINGDNEPRDLGNYKTTGEPTLKDVEQLRNEALEKTGYYKNKEEIEAEKIALTRNKNIAENPSVQRRVKFLDRKLGELAAQKADIDSHYNDIARFDELNKQREDTRKELTKLSLKKGDKATREALSQQLADINGQLEDLKNKTPKYWVDKNGDFYKLGQATVKEIEEQTPTRYYKTPLANLLIAYNNLHKIDMASQFMEAFKNNPDFHKVGIDTRQGAEAPEGWKSTDLPQFFGYKFEPRTAAELNRLNVSIKDDPFSVFSKVNTVFRDAIVFGVGVKHWYNELDVWAKQGGLIGRFGHPYRLFKTGANAFHALVTQSPEYYHVLERGGSLMMRDTQDATKLLLDAAGEQLNRDKPLLERVSAALGYANPIKLISALSNFSHTSAFAAHDLLTMQAVFEQMDKGYGIDEAIDRVHKYIPDYRIPATVLGSENAAKLIRNPNLQMFSAYHYGLFKSYGNMGKDLINVTKDPKTAAEALDKVAVAALLGIVVYPALDKVAQYFTHDKNKVIQRAGSTKLNQDVYKLATGQESMAQYLYGVATPAQGTEMAADLIMNKNTNPFYTTGQAIYVPTDLTQNPVQAAKDVGSFAYNKFAPAERLEQIQNGKQTVKDFLGNQLFNVTTKKSDAQRQLEQLYYEKDAVMEEIYNIKKKEGSEAAKEYEKSYLDKLDDLNQQAEKPMKTRYLKKELEYEAK